MLLVGFNHLGNEVGSCNSEEKLLADPHENDEAENQNVSEAASLKSCWHGVVEVWSSDLSSGILVHLDWSLDELASDLLVLVSWVVDAGMEELVDLHETEEGGKSEHHVGKALTGDLLNHNHDEAVRIVDPNEIAHLVEALVQQDALEKDFHCGVSLELGQHLDNVQ